jgi:hypothetical protein
MPVNPISSTPSPRSSSSPSYILYTWRRFQPWWSTSNQYTQLPQHPGPQTPHLEPPATMSRFKAQWRTYWFALILCCGGALFGYDSGVIGMLHQKTFKTKEQETLTTNNPRRSPNLPLLRILLRHNALPKNTHKRHRRRNPTSRRPSRLLPDLAGNKPVRAAGRNGSVQPSILRGRDP